MSETLPPATRPKIRYLLPDLLRGVAVVLMVIFHLSYDLNLFHWVTIDFNRDRFWFLLPRLIVALFMFVVGMGLYLVHRPVIRWPLFGRRLAFIGGNALLVSLVTYLLFPQHWIYWGTLHAIALCSLLALPFLAWPRVALGVGLALIAAQGWGIPFSWWSLPHLAMDYIPPLPWLGWVLFGIYAAAAGWHRMTLGRGWEQRFALLLWIGRHALAIYMLHQPLLYGLVWLSAS